MSIINFSMDFIPVVSAIAALFSAIYAKWSAKEAIQANNFGRLNALLAFRVHYLELMAQKVRTAEQLKGMKGADKAIEAYGELEYKLREVNREIDQCYENVVRLKKSSSRSV